MSDLELRAYDIKAGYVAWCRGEVTKRQAEEAFDWFVRALKADAWDEGKKATAIATYKLIELEENNPNATTGEMSALEPHNPYRGN